MKSSPLIRRFIKVFVFLLAIVSIISACELMDDLFNDDTKGNDNISDTGSMEIGQDGGKVSLNNLEISVPANAFNDKNNITDTHSWLLTLWLSGGVRSSRLFMTCNNSKRDLIA